MAIPETYRTPHGLSNRLRIELSEQARLVLGTINPDGSPHLTLVLFSIDADDSLLLPTPRPTRKIKNVRERASVTALVPVRSGWVSCYGEATVIEGHEAEQINLPRPRTVTHRHRHGHDGPLPRCPRRHDHQDHADRWLSWSHDVIEPWMDTNDIDASNRDTWWKDLSN